MKKHLLLLFSMMCAIASPSQTGFFDDFSDGDFTQSPPWQSPQNGIFFINSNKTLQLNAATAGTGEIATLYQSDTAMVWEFYLQMDFPPSGSNRCMVFLECSLDSSNHTKSFALLIGEDGSDDKIRFYHSQWGKIIGQPIFSAKNGFVVNNEVKIRLRISRTAAHLWTLEADYKGGSVFQKEAEFKDLSGSTADYGIKQFKIVTEFSSSRKDKFFFDDFKVGKPEIDQTAPALLTVKSIGNKKIELLFNEVLDGKFTRNTLNYSILPGPIELDSASSEGNRIWLHLAETLQPDNMYELHVGAVADTKGNVAAPSMVSFRSIRIPDNAVKHDVVINEIMADPLPQVALPKAEYIELYNRSKKYINLKGWSLKDAGKTLYFLPEYLLKPNQHLIISKRDEKVNFGAYGDTLNLPSLFALDSGPEELYLFDSAGRTIDELRYDIETYKSPSKSLGGYSLERINNDHPCLGAANFCASDSPDGGTPGKKNAVSAMTLKLENFGLRSVFPTDSATLLLTFDRTPELSSLNTLQISGLMEADTFMPTQLSNEIQLKLKQPLKSGQIYELTSNVGLRDCEGTEGKVDTFRFALPEIADKGDLILNELLFNPIPGGYDFIELFNNSAKAINLRGMYIGNDTDGSSRSEITENYLLMPGNYVVISENTANIALNYKVDAKTLLQNAIPSLPDEDGNVHIYFADAPGKRTIDQLNYSSKWHYPLLKDQNGVSLERLYFDHPTQDENNWGSAASVCGFATPGYTNSHHLEKKAAEADDFYLENDRMSPDNDGFEDFMLLHYNLAPDTNTKISIYDLNGQLVKEVLRNETLQTAGEIRWDGIREDGSRAPAGWYALIIEYFRPDGTTRKKMKLLTVVYKI